MAGGSTIGGLAQRRRALQASRKGLSPAGNRGAPQAPTRSNPSPPPVQTPEPGGTEAPPGQGQPGDVPTDEEALQQVGEFLQQRGAQAQGQIPSPQGGVEGVDSRPNAAQGPMITDRVARLGAQSRTPETQFFRIAGREATPREMSIFSARLVLERQLKRPPTANELRTFIARADSIAPVFSPGVERSGAGVAGPPPVA